MTVTAFLNRELNTHWIVMTAATVRNSFQVVPWTRVPRENSQLSVCVCEQLCCLTHTS